MIALTESQTKKKALFNPVNIVRVSRRTRLCDALSRGQIGGSVVDAWESIVYTTDGAATRVIESIEEIALIISAERERAKAPQGR